MLLTYAAIFLCEYKPTVQLQGLHRKACHMSSRSGRQAAPTNEIVVHAIFPTTFLSSDGLASQMWVPHWKQSDQVMYGGATLRISYLSKGQWLEFDTGRKDGRIIRTCLWSREFQVGPNFMQDAKSMKGLLSNLTPFLCGSLMNKASGRRSCLSCSSLPPCGADLHEKLEDYETSAICSC